MSIHSTLDTSSPLFDSSPSASEVAAPGNNLMPIVSLGTSAVFALLAAAQPHASRWLTAWHEVLSVLTAVGAFLAGIAAFGQFCRTLARDHLSDRLSGWFAANQANRNATRRPKQTAKNDPDCQM